MKTLRLGLTVTAALLLTGGYLTSQYSYFTGRASEFAAKMDEPGIRWLATFLFLAAIALTFVGREEEL